MSIISVNNSAIDRKNKQKLKNFVSTLNQYEQSLNKKVDDLVSHMINYSKKVQDSLVLPVIRQPKSATQRSKSFSKTIVDKKDNLRLTNRDKSTSTYSNFISSQISQNFQDKINTLKKSAAESLLQKNLSILPQGRQLGNKKYMKPKFWKRLPDILPRQIRLDPFAQKNIIKAQDLSKGVLSLIQKGKIGKDVDIITAFEKGGSVLNSQGAVLHQGQQRITRIQPIRKQKRQQVEQVDYSKIITKMSNIGYQENSWAITMPTSQFNPAQNIRKTIQLTNRNDNSQQIQQICHIKFVHYMPVENIELKKFKIMNLSFISEINSILLKISKLLQRNCLQVVYVNALKLLDFSTRVIKVKDQQLISCILTFKDKKKIPLNQIVNLKQKKHIAACKIISLFKMEKARRAFQRHLNIKKVEKKIYDWIYNFNVSKNFKKRLQAHKTEIFLKFKKQQQEFKKSYTSIQSSKHYQIHISNKSIQGRSSEFKQLLNTEITRIFNFQNPNTYIIMILSEPLAEETKNYYYKIMELEQIPNFRQRVTFLSAKSQSQFASNKFTSSQKLYYDSKLVRQLKSIIGKVPAYFRISYPSQTDLNMSVFLQIPIFTGDLIKLIEIQQRSQSINHFNIPELTSFRIQPNEYKPLNLSTALIQFCEKNKRYRNFVVKINNCYQSTGIGLLTYPFISLPEIYTNTALIYSSQNSTSQFYRNLCKKGGIIQAFQQNLNSIVLMGKISNTGNIQLTGTYDKISYGFVNIGYFFPQMTVSHNQVLEIFNSVSEKLLEVGHFGDFQISLYVDQNSRIYLDKVQCYQTEIGSSLFYFNFLCHGNLNSKGQFITQITETFETQDNKEEQIVSLQPRSYCYLPYILHFGLSDKQIGSFFQLCRMGGISFDLQNKYGSTFILLGSLKNSMGMITTAKDRQSCKKLMIKSLEFIIKQNAYNNSKFFTQEKEIRMRERQNILALKERLENL